MIVAWMLEAAAAVKSEYDNMRGDHELDKMLAVLCGLRQQLPVESSLIRGVMVNLRRV